MKLMGFPGNAYAKLGNIQKKTVEDSRCSFKEITLPPITDRRRIGRKGRLMERPALDSRNGKRQSWAADDKSHHAEYLKRLTRLRDQLVDQEETNLANALDRLRMRQISKEDANVRLRLRDSGTNLFSPRRRNMMTTLEKFKKTRPQKSPPTIKPLEGKQLIHPKMSDGPKWCVPEACEPPSFAITSKVDDSVQLNLQRLSQPISSIPNIGRKALRRDEMVLHSQGLEKKGPKNPMLKHTHALSQGTTLTPLQRTRQIDAALVPDAFKLEPLTEGDHIDMDKLRKYYYVYYLPSTSENEPSSSRTPKRHGKPRRVQSFRGSVKSMGSSCMSSIDDEGYSTNGKISLPCIDSTGSGVPHWNTPTFPDDLELQSMTTAHDPDYGTGRCSRVHIVVDMPDIIYSAPTPDIGDRLEMERSGSLAKTYKQNELRQRELQNLIEDVKELNIRTETLTSEYFGE